MFDRKAFGGETGREAAVLSASLIGTRRCCLKSVLFGTMLGDREDKLKTTPSVPCASEAGLVKNSQLCHAI